MRGLSTMRAGRLRRVALLLLACALFLRVMVPAGWMPQASASGVALKWCGESGRALPEEARAELAKALGAHGQQKHDAAPEHPCPFAVAAVALPAPEVSAALALPHACDDVAPALVSAVAPGLGLAAPPPFSTGPPLLG
ncbi:hypothetical protein [Sphingomonas sp. S2-65]|uniref:hypothetical protein n=1 Tax=Sphingomonas sp. S2-65 TaxID=2903960 RepID=UPI001F2B5C9E|nr:hypothetical protein [Sphingomonas sp. S2-65]UYY59077.1 hypothetical protein LZ586_02970 [Sphingomonas sp. S2-65]